MAVTAFHNTFVMDSGDTLNNATVGDPNNSSAPYITRVEKLVVQMATGAGSAVIKDGGSGGTNIVNTPSLATSAYHDISSYLGVLPVDVRDLYYVGGSSSKLIVTIK